MPVFSKAERDGIIYTGIRGEVFGTSVADEISEGLMEDI